MKRKSEGSNLFREHQEGDREKGGVVRQVNGERRVGKGGGKGGREGREGPEVI